MKYGQLLKTLPSNCLVIAIQSWHDTDVDEVCSVGRGTNVHNLGIFEDYEVEKVEYVDRIKTLSKNTTSNKHYIHDFKEGGYVVYLKHPRMEVKTLHLKGIACSEEVKP